MMKFLLPALLAFNCSAQVSVLPTNCFGDNNRVVTLSCPGGSTPTGHFVDFVVSNTNPGDIVVLGFGLSDDTELANFGIPIPLDLGIFFPSMPGCMLLTSASSNVFGMTLQQSCTLPVFFTLGVSGPFIFQAFVSDTGPAGIAFTNALEYFPN